MTGLPHLSGSRPALDLLLRAIAILVLALVILELLPALAELAG